MNAFFYFTSLILGMKKIVEVSLDYLNKSGNQLVDFQLPGKAEDFYRPRYIVMKTRDVAVIYY